MRKGILTLLLVLAAVSVWAVNLPKQGFGVQIGWAQPILRVNSPTNPNTAKDSLTQIVKMNGFKVGMVYDGSIIAGFGTSIGLNYTFGVSNGGWKSMYPTMGKYPQGRQFITYQELELFVDWQYKFEIAKETYLMLYTGPTIQCGLTWTMRQDRRDENLTTGEIVTTYGNKIDAYQADRKDVTPATGGYIPADNALNRINVTWGIGAGFQYKRYFLRGGYDFGLINPYANRDFVNGYHTRGRLDQWEIKLGVYLWYAD